MIDPRNAPVAMLPYSNGIVGFMINEAAPLRWPNVEDTEQVIAEVCEACDFDSDVMEDQLAAILDPSALDFRTKCYQVAVDPRTWNIVNSALETYLMALCSQVSEMV